MPHAAATVRGWRWCAMRNATQKANDHVELVLKHRAKDAELRAMAQALQDAADGEPPRLDPERETLHLRPDE